MATYTSNYAWTKPEGSDPVDITVLNNNLDSQDNIVHNAYMQLAPVFSTASTYAVGDVVLYANNLGFEDVPFLNELSPWQGIGMRQSGHRSR